MLFLDYYGESVTESIAYNVGRGTRNVATVVTTLNPIKAIGVVMVVWGSVAGIANYYRYRKGRITKKQAVTITASESVGMGFSAGVGLLADGVVNAFIITTTAPVLAFAVGVVVTAGVKIAWNCATKSNEAEAKPVMVWCERNAPQADQTGRERSVTA